MAQELDEKVVKKSITFVGTGILGLDRQTSDMYSLSVVTLRVTRCHQLPIVTHVESNLRPSIRFLPFYHLFDDP